MATLTAVWTELSTDDKLQRSSQSVALIDDKLFIFGGELVARHPRDNELFELKPDGQAEPRSLEVSAAKPTSRVGATMTAVKNKLYVFSGRGGVAMAPVDESGSLQVYDVQHASWTTIAPMEPGAAVPEARSYHCATTDGSSRVFIHAGCPEKGRLKDLWSFDINRRLWTRHPDAPGSPRGGSSIAYADGKLWRMNGFDGQHEIGGAIDVFDIQHNTWSTIEYMADGKTGPGARSVASLVAANVQGQTYLVTMFGEADPSSLGHAGAGKMLNDSWAFDVLGKEWKKLVATTDKVPIPRGWFDATTVGDGKIVVTGGLADSNERIPDAWLLAIS
ncbi:hypothetical protein AMS68_001618 [Peltaster fructicola]|uniref:Kelch repeat protein n=1 Tax=Peltaster fructicola TaxID=286661 RepID=A0A6H0XN76_9PEZI|nr:hypothetical protein AMS68_001618 [Peltaster fructicola]